MQSVKYLVQSAGRKLRPMTRSQIRDLCASGRIDADATVTMAGTNLRTPILAFLGQAEPPSLPEPASAPRADVAPKTAQWPTIAALGLLLLAVCGLGVLGTMTRQMASDLANQSTRIDQLQEQLAQLLERQDDMLDQMQRVAAVHSQPAVSPTLDPDQVSEIRELVGAVADYKTLIQTLAADVGADHHKTQQTDQMLQSVVERLEQLGVGPDGSPLPPDASRP